MLITNAQGVRCGDDDLRKFSSALLAKDREQIFGLPGLYTQGVSLMVLESSLWANPELLDFTSRYRRSIFYGTGSDLENICSLFPGAAYKLHSDLTLIEGRESTVIPLCQRIRREYEIPHGLTLKTLRPDDPDDLFSDLQFLQVGGGLESLATWFLRDHRLSRTIYLETDDGEIAGVSSIANLSSAGGNWQDTAIVQRTTVAPGFQRLGLGTYLKTEIILKGAAAFGATRFIGTVHASNIASYRMNAACGLILVDTRAFVGLEDIRPLVGP